MHSCACANTVAQWHTFETKLCNLGHLLYTFRTLQESYKAMVSSVCLHTTLCTLTSIH